jgi:hypothetical protein
MTPDLTPLPLSPKRLNYWRAQVKKARTKREAVAEKHGWQDNLDRYEPQARKRGRKVADINTGVDFADVESKKAALLFATPTVALTDCADGLQPAVAIHAELLNTILGPEHANVLPMAQRAIFNCLCPSGIGPVVVGYHCTKVTVEQEMMIATDESGQPVMDPLTGQPQTQITVVEVPIHEKFFVSDVSPKSLLLPAELRTTDYQGKAAWIGYEWQKPVSQIKREFKNVPPDWRGGGTEGEKPYFERDDDQADDDTGDPMGSGFTLWYRAELEPQSDQTPHPGQMRKLTMVDGIEKPVEHWDSQDQTLGPDGRLSLDSMQGFNVRPLVLRDLSDSAWIPSDCAVTASLTEEQKKYREMSMRRRDTNVDAVFYDAALQEPITKAKSKAGSGATVYVPIPSNLAGAGVSNLVQQITKANAGRETYLDQDINRRDRDRILAIGDQQRGNESKGAKTATEMSLVQKNTDARFEQERQKVEHWYLYDIVKPLDTLILRYCDERMATQILGPEKAMLWAQFKPALAGGYRYTLQMDSGKYLDVEDKRRQTLQLFNLLAKSPLVNQQFLHGKIAEDFGYDPTKFLVQPQPDKPEPPKLSLAFKGEDLVAPQAPIVLEILNALGVPISPQAIATSQALLQAQTELAMQQMPPGEKPGGPQNPTVPGPADKAPRLDQHQLSQSGDRSGPKVA